MSEKEAYIHEWIAEVSKKRIELGGFAVCPYASTSKTKIIECGIDDIVPESGYDVIVFIVEDFWSPERVKNWVEIYNQRYSYYKFFEDCAKRDNFVGGVKTNNERYNLILCQSKRKLKKIREKLVETDYYDYWDEEYLREILGDDFNLVKKEEN